MSQLNKTSFGNLYGTSGSTFPDNTTGEISEGDMRTFGQDIPDSFLSISDNFIDEDSFASNSATKVPSQQSVKAYVDAQVGSGVQTASITLSSAEILALNGTPKQIVAAPGVGKAIMVHNVFAFYTFVTTAYASTNDDLTIQYSGVSGIPSTILGFLSQTSSKWYHALPNNFGASSDISNTALIASVAGGNPTTGDSTAKIIVTYTIVNIP